MATAKSSTSKTSRSTSSSSKSGARKSSGSKSGNGGQASKTSSGNSQSGSKSAASKTTAASRKKAPSKGSSVNKTGASKTSGTAKKTASKATTPRSATKAGKGTSVSSADKKAGSAGNRARSAGASKSPAKKSSANGKGRSTAKRSNKSSGKSGLLESVKNAVTGLFSAGKPNAIDILTADHRVVDGYFQKVKENEDRNHRETYKKIQFELDAHAHIEETIFYPYLLEHGDKELKKMVREGIEEHRQMKLFLAELDELSGDNERFKAKLKVLIEDVEHHVEEEEDEMFAMAEDQVPREVLEKLGEQMEKEKARFQKRTSPSKAKRTSASR